MKKIPVASRVLWAFLLFGCLSAYFSVDAAWSMFCGRIGKNVALSDVPSKVESFVSYRVPGKEVLVDFNGLLHRCMGQRMMNDVILLSNGHETTACRPASEKIMVENADSVAELSKYVWNERNAEFLWVQIPYKNDRNDPQLPDGIVDASNDYADVFLDELRRNQTPYIDLREEIQKDGVDLYSLFLKTEHHWNAYGGFYAFQKICEYLRDECGERIDPTVLDLNNYEQTTWEKSSLGYYGQRTGPFFSGYDDFTALHPKFETESTCDIPHKDIHREGTFYDAVFDWEKLKKTRRHRDLYGLYIGGDYPLVIHENKRAGNPKTVMIFIDSFGTVPESFLTTAFQHVVAIDLRWVLRFGWTETAVDFMDRYDPDIVMVAFNPNQLAGEKSEQFQYGLDQINSDLQTMKSEKYQQS